MPFFPATIVLIIGAVANASTKEPGNKCRTACMDVVISIAVILYHIGDILPSILESTDGDIGCGKKCVNRAQSTRKCLLHLHCCVFT